MVLGRKAAARPLRHVDDAKLLADADIVLAAAGRGAARWAVLAEIEAGPAFIRKAVAIDPWHATPPTARGPGPRGRPRGRDARRLGLSSPLMP